MSKDQYLIIYNECSGGKKLRDPKQAIKKFFEREKIPHTFCFLCAPQEKIDNLDIQKRYDNNEFNKILVAGGDGTLRRTIEYLYKNDCLVPVGFYPIGSANTYARILNLPLQPQQILKNLLKRRHRHMSLGLLNKEHIFLWAACFGKVVEPTLQAESHAKDLLGGIAYLLATLKSITKFPHIPVSYHIDQEKSQTNQAHSALVLLNEGARMFVPVSQKWDGDLKFFLLKNENLLGFIQLLCQAYMLKQEPKNADVLSGQSILIKGEFEKKIHLDGDTIDEHTGTYHIEVLDEVATFLC
ncbi:hypothetical protein K9L63_02930 [Candidatus Gracilibacteria bacterium]|nr:hypothetical protein [Candidatus Gracilibacteria bacterium]